MAVENTVRVTMRIRSDTSTEWAQQNPVLAQGEYGLETNTYLLKIGDGTTSWNNLRYLNKLDTSYFKTMSDGSLTFGDTFATQINNLITNSGGSAHIIINDDPTESTDAINYSYLQRFVANAIAQSGHLRRAIVEELPVTNINENTIYMVPNSAGTGYDEYMYISNAWDLIGSTASAFTLTPATDLALGGVMSSTAADRISVNNEGFMSLTTVSTSKLYVPSGDALILNGGTATT